MKRLIPTLLAAVSAPMLIADTVAWYSMDGTVGGQSVYSVPCPNRVDSTKLPLIPGSIWSSTPIIGSGYSDSQKNARAPLFAAAFPDGWEVYDPVSGTAHVNRSAYRFVYGSAGRDAGGMAYLENDASLHLTTFTVEAFVKFETTDPVSYSAVAVFPAFMPANNCDAWGLRFESATILKARFAPPQEVASGTASGNIEVATTVPDVRDGLWHHVAVTFDGSTRVAKLYFDYQLRNSKTLAFVPWYTDNVNCRLTLGASVETNHNLQGDIDEFRYSDAALEPSQFLRMRRIGYATDADIAFQYDFEEASWFGSADMVLNSVDGGSYPGARVHKHLENADRDSQEFVPAVPYAELRPTITAVAAVTNTASLYNSYEGSAGGSYVKVADSSDLFASGSFTVECVFKGDGSINSWTPLLRRPGGSNVQMNLGFGGTSGILSTTVLQTDNSTVTFTGGATCNDGSWHHAAMVVDRDKGTLELYLDYALKCSKELNLNLVSTSSDILIAGTSSATFKGWLDWVRVTKRALTPSGFRTGFAAVTGATLGWARFERAGEYDSAVSPQALGGGVVAAETGGAVPAVAADAAVKASVNDGEDGAAYADLAGLSMNGGSLCYAVNPLMEVFADSQLTIEFFIKAGTQSANAPILRCNSYSATAGDPVFALSYGSSAGKLQLRMQTYDIYDWQVENYSNIADVELCDGRWHHVALSFYRFENNRTGFTLYRDYEPVINDTMSGRFAFGMGRANLWIGGGNSAAGGLVGSVDELRVSQGQLVASQFLHTGRSPLLFLVR